MGASAPMTFCRLFPRRHVRNLQMTLFLSCSVNESKPPPVTQHRCVPGDLFLLNPEFTPTPDIGVHSELPPSPTLDKRITLVLLRETGSLRVLEEQNSAEWNQEVFKEIMERWWWGGGSSSSSWMIGLKKCE